MPAAVDDSGEDFVVEMPPDILEEPAAHDLVELAVEPADLGDRSSIAAKVREDAPDEPLPLLSEGVVRAREETVSIEHGIQPLSKASPV